MFSNESLKEVFHKLCDKVLLPELSVVNTSDWLGSSVMLLGSSLEDVGIFVPANS